MRFFIQLVFCSLIYSCGGCFSSRPNEKVKIASEIRSKTLKKLEKEMGLIPCGSGGQMMYQIEMLGLAFQYRHSIDVEKGRRILMQAINEFLKEINSNERIRPYLDVYPFEPKNIEILIVLQSPDGSNIDNGKLELIFVSEGILQYQFNNSDSSKYKETYEEACKILEERHEAS